MQYEEYETEIVSAMNRARNGNIVSRLAIEMEITNNPGHYPRLVHKRGRSLRVVISRVLFRLSNITVLCTKRPVFVVSGDVHKEMV